MIGSLFVTGPAGTGKSTFCGSFKEWLIQQGYDVAAVNLDPGAEYMPYNAEIDVREYISLQDIMSQYSLGPNGAQIVAADLLLENVDKIESQLKELQDYYVIFDTPGQMELFTFRQGSTLLVDRLSMGKGMLAFIADSVVSSSPSGYISQKMLYGSVMSRFYKPMILVMNKADLVDGETMDRISRWEESPDILQEAFMEEKQEMVKDYFSGILEAFKSSDMITKIFPVSSRDLLGFEDIYSEMSVFFTGGEDADTLYRDD
jgi:GTPase SAR1 family protein